MAFPDPEQPACAPTSPDRAAALAARDPLEGTPYRGLFELGRGGMGEVWEAEHRALGKRVVVKLLHLGLAGHAGFSDRLRFEAQALAQLASAHLVEVNDCGQTPRGRPYFVMERLQGSTLRVELKRRGALPVPEAIDVVLQVLAGLAAVHQAGLVHRDVKLDNVFYCEGAPGQRRIKLLDFGIVKVLSPVKDGPRLKPPAIPTERGVAMGTPRYLAPEQVSGQPVDARSDLYAVGLVLYGLIAGRGPFDHRKGGPALLNAQTTEAPEPPSFYSPQAIPAALDALVLQALAKNPARRMPSARAFAAQLASIRQALSRAAPRSSDGLAVVPLPHGPRVLITRKLAEPAHPVAPAMRWARTERMRSSRGRPLRLLGGSAWGAPGQELLPAAHPVLVRTEPLSRGDALGARKDTGLALAVPSGDRPAELGWRLEGPALQRREVMEDGGPRVGALDARARACSSFAGDRGSACAGPSEARGVLRFDGARPSRFPTGWVAAGVVIVFTILLLLRMYA